MPKNKAASENPYEKRTVGDWKYCDLPDDGNTCIRLRGANGNYLSLLPCGVDPDTGRVTVVDLATPDGKVLYCGVPNGLVDEIIEHLGLEKIL